MNLIQELQALDVNEPGRWPLPFRIAAVVLIFVLVSAFGSYMFVIKSDIPLLESAQRSEQDLRSSFETRQRRAANFTAYRAQLDEIERSFGTMLRQLPGRTEIPSLLVDISQTALGAGLDENLFQRGAEVQRLLALPGDGGPGLSLADGLIQQQPARGALPGRFDLLLGYAGWAPQQLEAELERGSWLHAPFDAELLFDVPVVTRWDETYARLGVSPTAFMTVPGGAQA